MRRSMALCGKPLARGQLLLGAEVRGGTRQQRCDGLVGRVGGWCQAGQGVTGVSWAEFLCERGARAVARRSVYTPGGGGGVAGVNRAR